jgi:hypothetical protein
MIFRLLFTPEEYQAGREIAAATKNAPIQLALLGRSGMREGQAAGKKAPGIIQQPLKRWVDFHKTDPVIRERAASSIPVAVAAERILKPGLLRDLEGLIFARLRAADAKFAGMPRLAAVMARRIFDKEILPGVFPERFERTNPPLDENDIAAVAKETSFSRKQILDLAESLLAAPAQAEKATHAAIFIPLAAELSITEQQELFDTAVRESRSSQGKAVVFVTSARMPAVLLQTIESLSEGRVAILDGVGDPVRFMGDLFDTGKKLPPQMRRKVHGAVRKAYENVFGQGGPALRNIARHSLVLAAPRVFKMPEGMIGQVSQQFLFREGRGDPARVYDAYLRYAIRIGGHLKAADIDERLRENLLVRDHLSGRPGITEISFTPQGLDRVLNFLTAIAHTRKIQVSA